MPTVSFAPYAVPQFLDNAGDPVVGGTLETYLAGTSIPAATYADSDGVAPNPTTIPLDTAGRPSNGGALIDLRLDVTKSYKFVLKNSSGAIVRTVDNINGGVPAGSVVTESLAEGAVDNASLADHSVTPSKLTEDAAQLTEITRALRYKAPFADSVTRTLEERIGDHITVRDAGAKGNGSTNDTAAFSKAAAAAPNGIVFVPKTSASYVVSSSVVNDSTIFVFEGGRSNLTGSATPEQLRAVFLGQTNQMSPGMYMGGTPIADGLRGGRIEIVAGVIRQNTDDRTKWDYISDSGHVPLGVAGASAVAAGSEVTVTFAKAYKRVLSMVMGPDELLSNRHAMSVGASVGFSSMRIKAAINKTLSATVWWNGSEWRYTYGAGQGSTADNGNVSITGISIPSAGTVQIDHTPCPGTNVSVIPNTRGGVVIPYIPALRGITDTQIAINYINPATDTLRTDATATTRMSMQVNKSFRGGVLLDGTGGSDMYRFNLGNIWFFGIMELD